MTANPRTAPPEGKPPSASETVGEHVARLPSAARWTMIVAILAGMLLSNLDQTVVGTVMPQALGDLHGTATTYTWVTVSYLLTSTVTIPLYGRFSDLYGRKNLLLLGLVVFLGGSVLSGLSGTLIELIAFRAVQGLGAGALLTLCAALLRDCMPASAMARMQTILATTLVVGFLGGPLLGGVLADHASWRWAFFVNIPVCAAIIVVVALLLPGGAARPEKRPRVDLPGIALLATGLSLLLLGLSLHSAWVGTPEGAWTSLPVGGCLVLAAVVLAGLLAVERRAELPVLPLHLVRNRSFAAVTVAGMLFRVVMFPVVMLMPLYFQQVRELDATRSGLLLLPIMGGLVLGNRLTSVIVRRRGRAKSILLGAAAVVTVATLGFLVLDEGTSLVLVSVLLFLVGLSLGPSMGGIISVAQASVDRADMGVATAGFVLLGQIGITLGLAVGQDVLSARLSVTTSTAHAIGTTIGLVGLISGCLTLAALVLVHDVALSGPGGGGSGPGAPRSATAGPAASPSRA